MNIEISIDSPELCPYYQMETKLLWHQLYWAATHLKMTEMTKLADL